MATETELLTARIVFNAVFPVMKVLLEEDPRFQKAFRRVTATVQVMAKNEPTDVAAHLKFTRAACDDHPIPRERHHSAAARSGGEMKAQVGPDGGIWIDVGRDADQDLPDVVPAQGLTDAQRGVGFEVVPGKAENPEITLAFSSVAKMNAMFAGKPVVPRLGPMLGNLRHFGTFMKVMKLLMAMKLLQPDAKPKNAEQARLKVKMTIYMITTALSQLNKAGDPAMVKWTTKQPERVYQWSCEPEGIAAYLKIKAGQTKAGRGYYAGRKPFVHMKFAGAENALPVLSNSVDLVQAMGQGMIAVEGSPEYASHVGNFMVRIATLLS